eukprot:TRINITY_DN1693_c0_g1_i1.p1 TRINITY_DN1693_c0_g1~~TRINITY_DN1693_c0_g1_i1.p1  ORF type:complete len:544 (-),score=84.41 TRINITY_DN1693_c0_g1_i1:670-2301(-)
MEAPRQQSMDDALPSDLANNTAYRALAEANLICSKYAVKNFDELVLEQGTWDVTTSMILQAVTCPFLCHCCCQLKFFVVDPGCANIGSHSDGTNLFFGPGVHILCKCFKNAEDESKRVADSAGAAIVNGTKAIITVQQGYVGLAFEKGEPVLLPPGLHQWDTPDITFDKSIDLSASLITMGPYTLVTVEECYSAITQDNGKQKVLDGGKSYMLTHQNWKFQAWLSQKMQTNKFGPLSMTTGDNINLDIVANVNWIIREARIAAARNVDTTNSKDSLKMMRDDVILQVTSSLASLVGAIQYGARGTSSLQEATRSGHDVRQSSTVISLGDTPAACAEPEPETKTGRQALWDPTRLKCAVDDANNICNSYGVEILSINLISASPSDQKLNDIMSRGAIASVSAEETAKAARAETNAALIAAEAQAAQAQAAAEAMLIKARSEAEAMTIAATADADAERIRAQGAKEAGMLMGESEVATSLAKLKIAYGPFAENKASTYFFGLNGPGDLPTALLGNSLAMQTGTAGLDMGGRGGAQGDRGAGAWFS